MKILSIMLLLFFTMGTMACGHALDDETPDVNTQAKNLKTSDGPLPDPFEPTPTQAIIKLKPAHIIKLKPATWQPGESKTQAYPTQR